MSKSELQSPQRASCGVVRIHGGDHKVHQVAQHQGAMLADQFHMHADDLAHVEGEEVVT